MKQFSLFLLLIGGVFIIAGILTYVVASIGGGKGILPGDIHWQKNGWEFYFPLTSCILISVFLTIILNLIIRWFR